MGDAGLNVLDLALAPSLALFLGGQNLSGKCLGVVNDGRGKAPREYPTLRGRRRQ